MNGTSIAAVTILCSVGLAPAAGPPVGAASVAPRAIGPPASAERLARGATAGVSDRVIVFGDGTRLWLAEDLAVTQLQEGVTVKLSYEERNGQHVVTSIEAAE